MISCILLVSVLLNKAPAVAGTAGAGEAARAEFEAGNYSAALKTLNGGLSQAPQDALLHYWSLRAYYELRDFERAVTSGESAVKLEPQNSEYSRWLGRAYGARAEQSHSFFLARKVKQAFEAAVHLAPTSVAARRDLMQYLAEAPWIVGGDKQKAREQIDAISKIDPVQGHLARGAYFATDKKWTLAEAEYAAVLSQQPPRIDIYMEIADFFADRKDAPQIDRLLEAARRIDPKDPRIDYFSAVSFILRRNELPTAEKLLRAYIAKVPQRSDYPSHSSAQEWLGLIGRREAQAR